VLRKGIVSVSYVVKTPPSVFQPPHEVNTDWKRDLSIAICSKAKERDAQREMKRNDDRAAGEEGGNERENNAEDAANEAEDKLDQRADADVKDSKDSQESDLANANEIEDNTTGAEDEIENRAENDSKVSGANRETAAVGYSGVDQNYDFGDDIHHDIDVGVNLNRGERGELAARASEIAMELVEDGRNIGRAALDERVGGSGDR